LSLAREKVQKYKSGQRSLALAAIRDSKKQRTAKLRLTFLSFAEDAIFMSHEPVKDA
jgi:hypothetical protein